MEKHLQGSVPVTREHKEMFDAAYLHMPPAVSDMVFANLVGWQHYFAYHVLSFRDLLCVHFVSGKRLEILPPLQTKPCTDQEYLTQFLELAEAVRAHCAGNGLEPVFRYFPNTVIARLGGAIQEIIPERDYFDYVYDREEFVTLPGERFSPKRNLINQFKGRYKWEYLPLDEAAIPAAKEYMDKRRLDTEKHLTSKEYCIGCEMLNTFDLGYIGGILKVDGAVVGVTIGSVVERFEYEGGIEPSVVVHFENADISFKGAYQIINQQFCEHLPAHIKFINREEDLGLAGLRKAKTSYNPVRFIEKSVILPK